MADLMSKLHPSLSPGEFDIIELLNHEPPMDWRPSEIGELIAGVVSMMDTGKRDNYTFPVMYLMTADGRLMRVRCSAMMLKKQITEQRIGTGSIVSVRYSGSAVGLASGREYRKFVVRSL